MAMTWWYWLLLGLLLAGAEMVAPGGFYLLFFGIAALAVGALAGFELVAADWLQWLLFSVIAVVSMLLFRNPLLRMSQEHKSHPVDTMVGEAAVLLEDLPGGQTGKAELRGSTWSARNAGEAPLRKGQRATVAKVDGLTLWLKPE
jgi:membrane protein implicated in regulation of membrane protease activity